MRHVQIWQLASLYDVNAQVEIGMYLARKRTNTRFRYRRRHRLENLSLPTTIFLNVVAQQKQGLHASINGRVAFESWILAHNVLGWRAELVQICHGLANMHSSFRQARQTFRAEALLFIWRCFRVAFVSDTQYFFIVVALSNFEVPVPTSGCTLQSTFAIFVALTMTTNRVRVLTTFQTLSVEVGHATKWLFAFLQILIKGNNIWGKES